MGRIWDISLPYSPDIPCYPGASKPVIERRKAIAEGANSNVTVMNVGCHHATHVDAPVHYVDGAGGVDTLGLDVLIGPAQVVDVGDAPSVTAAFLDGLGLGEDVERLLFKTANSALWEKLDHDFYMDFVAVAPDAADWIVAHGVKLVGIDYLSVETVHTDTYPTHKRLLGAAVVVIEGLDFRSVEPGTYQLVCLPLNIPGSDGAPARVVLMEA